jgi:hypothetical protein
MGGLEAFATPTILEDGEPCNKWCPEGQGLSNIREHAVLASRLLGGGRRRAGVYSGDSDRECVG